MKGTIYDVTHEGPDGRYVALVLLGDAATDDVPCEVYYWPELLTQWGPAKLRRYLILEAHKQCEAERAVEAQHAAAAAHAEQLAGEDVADPAEFETPAASETPAESETKEVTS